jgi:hypothetical protein
VSAALHEATIQQQCKQLHLPAVAAQCAPGGTGRAGTTDSPRLSGSAAGQ